MPGSKNSLHSDSTVNMHTWHHFPYLKTSISWSSLPIYHCIPLLFFTAKLFETFTPTQTYPSLSQISFYFLLKVFHWALATNPLKPPLSSLPIISLLNPISDLILLDLFAAFDTIVSLISLKISSLHLKNVSSTSLAAVSQVFGHVLPSSHISALVWWRPHILDHIHVFLIYSLCLDHHFQCPGYK